MNAHATPETRQASTPKTTPDERTAGPDFESDTEAGQDTDLEPSQDTDIDGTSDEPAPMAPFETHDTAATFGDDTERLPNTVDEANTYLGQAQRQFASDTRENRTTTERDRRPDADSDRTQS